VTPEPPDPGSRRRRALTALIAVCVAAATVAATGFVFAYVPVLPGIRGCTLLVGSAERAEKCVADRTFEAMSDDTPAAAIAELEGAAVDSAVIGNVCHRAMHVVASRRLDDLDRDVQEADARGDCGYGYVHGLLETAVLRADDDPTKLQLVIATCSRLDGPDREVDAANCRHGVGHGLRRASDTREEAAASCRLPESADEHVYACLSGVYMEDAWHTDAASTRTEALTWCDDVDEDIAARACGAYVPDLIGRFDERGAGAARACREIERDLVRLSCLRGAGSVGAAGEPCLYLTADPSQETAADRRACWGGSVFAAVIQTKRVAAGDFAKACTQAEVDEDVRACAEALGAQLTAFSTDRSASCNKLFKARATRDHCAAGSRDAASDPATGVGLQPS
jgi:hypothetical protein